MTPAQWLNQVQQAAAIRRVRRMQPAGGAGDKLFPPTYPGAGRTDPARHVFERRRVGSDNALCVLIDSVQSQANRLEEALGDLRASGAVRFPTIAVTFENSNELADIGVVDTLMAPHRVFDAIIRDSMLGGEPFGNSDEGKALVHAKPQSAAAIYQLSPSTLVFGAWNSTGQGGGLGAKFPRAVVSEIVGVNVATDAKDNDASGWRTSSRIDPLGVVSSVRVFKRADGDWTVNESEAEKNKNVAVLYYGRKKTGNAGRPALVNHGNIKPDVDRLGVSVDYVTHSFVLSLPALRRLRFLGNPGKPSPADPAAQAALAALGLIACLAQDQAGYALRSRCDLVPDPGEPSGFEWVKSDGTTEPLPVDLRSACALFTALAEQASANGLAMRDSDLVLQPQEKLLALVRKSRDQALTGEAEADDE